MANKIYDVKTKITYFNWYKAMEDNLKIDALVDDVYEVLSQIRFSENETLVQKIRIS